MKPRPRFSLPELFDQIGLQSSEPHLRLPGYNAVHGFEQDLHWPQTLRSWISGTTTNPLDEQLTFDAMKRLRPIEEAMAKGFRGFSKFLPIAANSLNALDFAPIPEGLIQQMIQKLQPPNV